MLLSVTNQWDRHHAPQWDGGHIKFWSPQTLRLLLESEGVSVVGWKGAGRCPWIWKSFVMMAVKQ